MATIRLNLASLTQGQGDFAQAISHLEAAVDMGRRAGRQSTTSRRSQPRQPRSLPRSLCASANEHRVARRAKSRASHRWHGAAARSRGRSRGAHSATPRQPSPLRGVRDAYDALGRGTDAAEARLESVLLAARLPGADRARSWAPRSRRPRS